MPVSEKTLELNIVAELNCLLQRRGFTPMITGLSLFDEAQYGYDTRIDLGWRAFFLQFKRARRRRRDGHTFYINNDSHHQQHPLLLQLPGSFYVLPRLFSCLDLIIAAPYVINQSLFVDTSQIGPLVPNNEGHRVKLFDGDPFITVLSQQQKVKGIEGKDFLNEVLGPSDIGTYREAPTLSEILRIVQGVRVKKKWEQMKRSLGTTRLVVLQKKR